MNRTSDPLDGLLPRDSPTRKLWMGFLYWAALSLAVPIALMVFFFFLDWIQHL